MNRLTRLAAILAVLTVFTFSAGAQEPDDDPDAAPYFSLSASQTFASNSKATINLTTVNVDSLEFRVYRVNDVVKFFEQLESPNSFGRSAPPERGQRTLLEQIRGWKRSLRATIRREMRAQFTEAPHEHIAALETAAPPRPVSREIRYAQVPVLNAQQLVLTFQQPILGAKDQWSNQTVDIGVRDKGVYLVEAVRLDLHAYTILMVSDLVLTTKTARGRIVNFVANRTTGEPIADAEVWMLHPGAARVTAKTSADGLAELPIGVKPDDLRIVVRSGSDVGANALASYSFAANEDRWMGYIYTDRPVYRPGHTVQFKGIFRARTPDGYQVPKSKSVAVKIQDASGKDVFQKTLAMSANGTVRDQLVLANDTPLGYYSIEVREGDNYLNGSFEVEEYKKPEYEVRVVASKTRVLQGEKVSAVIDARYYFGEPVSGAAVKYSVYRERYWFPLWYDPDDDSAVEEGEFDDGGGGEEISQGEGVLNEDGKLTIEVPTQLRENHTDSRYRVEAHVTDPARREITGSGAFVATYGSFVVNLSSDRYFYVPGSRAAFVVEARTYENMPVATAVRVELLRRTGSNPNDVAVVGTATAATDANGTGRAEIVIPQGGGSYRARVTARTPEGRNVEDYTYFWVSGAGEADEFSENRQNVDIVPDKKTYRPGDTARVLIAAGRPQTPVLVSVEGRDLRMQQVLRSADPTLTFELPITLRDEPGLYVTAQFVRDGMVHRSSKYIRVPAEEHRLNIAVTTDKPQYRPGDTAVYSFQVTDAAGKAVPRAELSLGVVDEAIYAIRPDMAIDPLKYFFGREWNSVQTEDSLNYYFSGDAGKRRMQLASLRASSKLAQLKPERLALPKVRKAFPDTAFWAPDLVTDAQGRVQARVALPDSLTTWRATTRGVTEDSKVGAAVVKNITRKNVILRLATPRFMVRGDEITISGIVHNYLENAKDAKVSIEVAGLDVIDGGTKTVPVPARGEVRVDWRVRASKIGIAKITGRALTNEESDALEVEIPVNSPGVPLSQSKGGSLSAGAATAFDLAFPTNIEGGSRKLSLRVSPSIAGALFGAVEFLTSFPYGCVEQTMSSFLPNIIVQQTVRDLGLKVDLDQAALREKIVAGLDRLYAFQHEDGGWGWWETDESHAFMTAYVVAGLQQAARAGDTQIRGDVVDRGAKWLEDALASTPRLAPDLRAYILFALSQRDTVIPATSAQIDTLYGQRAQLSPYGLALLGLTLELRKDGRAGQVASALEQNVQQDAEQAWWPAARDEMLDFSTDATAEATAHVVRFLSHQKPASPLLPKAAVWLMNHRNEGYWWSSTKQTAMVIYGLTDYLKVTKELNPDLTATVTVNGRVVITRKFDQAIGVGETALVLTESELQAGSNHIEVKTNGRGRLYYSTRAEYSSSEERLERNGTVSLNILRDYFRLVPTQLSDRIVYDTAPLTGPVASGDTIAVRLTVTGSDWRYLLIEDPIPAGTEFIERDQRFEIRNRPPWWSYSFTRREMHDDRMAMFVLDFPRGQEDYFYLLKVVNPGTFHASPARVQPMYQPGVLATTGSRTLEVK